MAPRILIVDNEPAIGLALTRLLEVRAAMHAVVAHSADEAEAEIARGSVDAMLLDYHLPGMRGDAFYYRACELQPSIARRTVFITGDLSARANDAITSTGCSVLLKPFAISVLIAELHRVIGATESPSWPDRAPAPVADVWRCA